MKSIAILGNIGSGKSELAEALAHELGWTFVPEPVQQWINSGFMKAYYDDPKRYAFAFQCYVFITRRKSYSAAGDTPRVYDSHLITDPAFVRSLVIQGYMTEQEAGWYKETYEGWEKEGKPCEPDFYIYLDVAPASCLTRILEDRKRVEETSITLEYLRQLALEFEHTITGLGEKVVRIDASHSRQEVLMCALKACKDHFSVGSF